MSEVMRNGIESGTRLKEQLMIDQEEFLVNEVGVTKHDSVLCFVFNKKWRSLRVITWPEIRKSLLPFQDGENIWI